MTDFDTGFDTTSGFDDFDTLRYSIRRRSATQPKPQPKSPTQSKDLNAGSAEVHVPPPEGERYEVEVPDTLDLAERAGYALNALIGMLDPNLNYEIWFHSFLGTNPPYMYHDTTGLPTNNPKFAESFPLMRVMSGSERGLDMEEGMMRMMVGLIAEDGLYYAPVKEERPWHEGVGHVYRTADGEIVRIHEDFANVYGNARMMLAMMAWYQRDRNPAWLTRIENMARGLAKIAAYKDDYAYFPDSGIGEAFSYPRSGWRSTEEPATERMGAEGSTLMYHGGKIRALSPSCAGIPVFSLMSQKSLPSSRKVSEALTPRRRAMQACMKKRTLLITGEQCGSLSSAA